MYLLDLDARRVTRVPDAGIGNPGGRPPSVTSSLRRDYEPVLLMELVSCEVGVPMQLLLDVRRDGIPTLRTSTCVRDLRKLDGRAGCMPT